MTRPTNPYQDVAFDHILKCVHCGLCLDACPTYRELGTEQDSPRGRLYLMRGLWEGELPLDKAVTQPLSRCLDCRACETACPSGVPYGELLEKTRGVLLDHAPQPPLAGLARALLGRGILIHRRRLALAAKAAYLYQKLGLPRLVTDSPLTRFLPKALVQAHRTMPQFAARPFSDEVQPQPEKSNQPAVALFTGCIMDVAETQIHTATTRLLRAAGYRVEVPKTQVCCGALLVHDGMRREGRALALRNLQAFMDLPVEVIIVNAAGCGAQLKEYHHLFPAEANPMSNGLGPPVRDLLDFLAELPHFVRDTAWRKEPVSFFYDAPCHLIHAQRIDAAPRALLKRIPGLNPIPLCEAERCCGAAGIYNLKHPDLANQILDRKLDDLADRMAQHPQARYLVTANPGCLLQLRAGVARRNLPIQVVHPAVLLAEQLLD